MKVYIAKHKKTGKPFCGRKTVYEDIGGLKVAMKRNWMKANIKDYDVYCYELKDGEIVE